MFDWRKLLRRRSPTYTELVSTLNDAANVVERQALVVDAAEALVDALTLMDPSGEPAVAIATKNPIDAHTIAHRLWELSALLDDDVPPPTPFLYEGVIN